MSAISARLGTVSGWRRILIALLAGGLTTLALPPAHVVPILLVTFPALVLLLHNCHRLRDTLLTGFAFGLGYSAIGLYWIGFALLVDAAQFAWLLPFAVFGIASVMAVFTALACLPTRYARTAGLSGTVLSLAIGWTLSEWVRNWIFTGFPWNPLGSVWDISTAMLQPASVVGVFGLSLLTLVLAALPVLIPAASGRQRLLLLAGFGAVLGGWFGYGEWRLSGHPTAYQENIGLRLVQANINQRDKWRPELRLPNLTRLLALSHDNRPDWITHVIWPETAATFFLSQQPEVRRAIAGAAPDGGAIITGAPRTEPGDDGSARYYNSLMALNGSGEIIASYDKFHLVPFGEYVPLRDWLPLDRIVPGRGDFSAGPGPRTLRVGSLPAMGPLICYEAIFPGNVTVASDRPEWLLNISNDAWFGLSAGPYQHLAASRMRAVEEGLPLVRATNTGISAVIDPAGRELQRLGLEVRGILDSRLPKPIAYPTLFSLYGNGIPLGLVLIVTGGLLWRVRQTSMRSENRSASYL